MKDGDRFLRMLEQGRRLNTTTFRYPSFHDNIKESLFIGRCLDGGECVAVGRLRPSYLPWGYFKEAKN